MSENKSENKNESKTATTSTMINPNKSSSNPSTQTTTTATTTTNGNPSQSSTTTSSNNNTATANTTSTSATTAPTTSTTDNTNIASSSNNNTNTNTNTPSVQTQQDQKSPEKHEEEELEESDTNLIINYIPPSMNEGALGALFSPYGTMQNIKIVVDPHTGHSRGYGFVKYESAESAAQALRALNGCVVAGKKLKVAYSRPQSKEIQNANLYVTNVPKNWDNQKLGQVFKPFGYVIESRILLDQDNKSRGVGFVRMDNHTNAVKAIVGIHGHRVEGGNELVVKLAQKKNQNRRWDNSQGKDNNDENPNRENKNFNNNRKSGGNFSRQGDTSEFYNKRNSSHRGGRQYRRRGGGSGGSMMDPSTNAGFYQSAYDTYSQPTTAYYGSQAMGSSGMRGSGATVNANVLPGGDSRPYSAQSYSIMVRNLPEHYNVDHLIKLYAPFGPIQSVNIQKAKSGHAQTYGVVSYFFAEDAKNAAEQTHGRLEANHHLEVTWQ